MAVRRGKKPSHGTDRCALDRARSRCCVGCQRARTRLVVLATVRDHRVAANCSNYSAGAPEQPRRLNCSPKCKKAPPSLAGPKSKQRGQVATISLCGESASQASKRHRPAQEMEVLLRAAARVRLDNFPLHRCSLLHRRTGNQMSRSRPSKRQRRLQSLRRALQALQAQKPTQRIVLSFSSLLRIGRAMASALLLIGMC